MRVRQFALPDHQPNFNHPLYIQKLNLEASNHSTGWKESLRTIVEARLAVVSQLSLGVVKNRR